MSVESVLLNNVQKIYAVVYENACGQARLRESTLMTVTDFSLSLLCLQQTTRMIYVIYKKYITKYCPMKKNVWLMC